MKVMIRRGSKVRTYNVMAVMLCNEALKDGELDIRLYHDDSADAGTRVTTSVLMAHAALSTVAAEAEDTFDE